MSSTITLPTAPYNVHTLGGQTASLYGLVTINRDNFPAVYKQAQQAAQKIGTSQPIVSHLHRRRIEEQRYGDVPEFRRNLFSACQAHLSAAVKTLARHPAPWRLRAKDIPDVNAFTVFAEEGIVSRDAATLLVESARAYLMHAERLSISLKERAEFALHIWGVMDGAAFNLTDEQTVQLNPLWASYGLPLSIHNIHEDLVRERTAFRNAFQLDLMQAYHEAAQDSLSKKLEGDNDTPQWMLNHASDVDHFEGLTWDTVNELYRVGLIDKKLHYGITLEISRIDVNELSWDPPPSATPVTSTEP